MREYVFCYFYFFFFSSRRRHTICALVTGVQTCALPIFQFANLTPAGELDLDDLYAKLSGEVKLLALTHVSNVLGTVNPVAAICREARKRGIVSVVDGSQALPHQPVDVAAIGCDFYAFTGHKMLGPTGTGGLWADR